MPLDEIRITDPTTGGQKGSKLARFDLVPPEASWALAEVYGAGTKKYADRNWEKGYQWGLSVAALERHLNLWKQGESIDAETGCYHLSQVAWHAFALFIFELRGLGTDDVRNKNPQPEPEVQTGEPVSSRPDGFADWVRKVKSSLNPTPPPSGPFP